PPPPVSLISHRASSIWGSVKIACASSLLWVAYHACLSRVVEESASIWLSFGLAYFFLTLAFVAAAVKYKAIGFTEFLGGQVAKLKVYTVVAAPAIAVGIGTGASWVWVAPSVTFGVYTGEIAHQLASQGDNLLPALFFFILPRKTQLKGFLGFVYLVVFVIVSVYIWAVIAVQNPNTRVAITGVAYPSLVMLVKFFFQGALNKAWSSSDFAGNDTAGATAVSLNEKYSFSSPVEGKKWIAFIYTSRNFGVALKLVNYVLVLATMADQTLGKFLVNIFLQFGTEFAFSGLASFRFSKTGLMLQSQISAQLGSVGDNGGAAVATPAESPTSIVLDKLHRADKSAQKFTNEDMGELAAIFIATLMSIDVVRAGHATEEDIAWTAFVARGGIIAVTETVLDTMKVRCLHEPMGIRSSKVEFEVAFLDILNAALTSLATGSVIWGVLLVIK
ncbi:hypothetical protein TrLO_g2994, partial [Triparma laevis f. longispina]